MNSKLKLLFDVYEKLLSAYGEQGWWPLTVKKGNSFVIQYDPSFKLRDKSLSEKFEISVGAILTQNTSWKNVEKALLNLKSKNILSPEKIVNNKIKDLIKPAGYYNIKEKKLKEFSKFFIKNKRNFGSNNILREELLSVWGIGKETADSILLYALNKPFFVVDAYTRRLFSRLNLINEKEDYDKIQLFFHKNLPSDYKLFNEFHALIVEHAKRHCRKKPLCDICPLRTICSWGKA